MAPAALVLVIGAKGADSAASATSMTQVTGQRATDLIEVVASALDRGQVTTKAPAVARQLDRAKVYRVDAEDASYTSVTVPVGGSCNSHVSNLTVVVGADGTIGQSGETLFSENAEGNVTIASYPDGALVRSTDTDRSPQSADQLLAADAASEGVPTTLGAGSTIACVATVMGVSGATASLIVGACAGACTVPVVGTAICGASIGAVAGCL